MSTEQVTETTETATPEAPRPLTKQERVQALIEVHSFLSDLQRPSSNTLSKVYEDSLVVLAQVINSALAEVRAEAEETQATVERKTAKTTETE